MQIPNTLYDNENSKLEEILRNFFLQFCDLQFCDLQFCDLQIYVELYLNQLKNFD